MIPVSVQSELNSNQDKAIRVIVLINDAEPYDDLTFEHSAKKQLLNGYAESDSIYDND